MAEKGKLKKSVTKLKNRLMNSIHNADLETLVEMAKQRGIAKMPDQIIPKSIFKKLSWYCTDRRI